jgi:hypothetical protein
MDWKVRHGTDGCLCGGVSTRVTILHRTTRVSETPFPVEVPDHILNSDIQNWKQVPVRPRAILAYSVNKLSWSLRIGWGTPLHLYIVLTRYTQITLIDKPLDKPNFIQLEESLPYPHTESCPL